MAKPKFPFTPEWWINNHKIRTLSDDARSVLMDIMIHMMDGEPYGSLVISGLKYNIETLAKVLGRTYHETENLLNILVLEDLISIDETGTIYSDYMAHQCEVRERRSIAGLKGGNPLLNSMKKKEEEKNEEPTEEKKPEPFYETKKKRKLKGTQLIAFNSFWDVFDDKLRGGRAQAADAWLDLKVDKNLFDDIIRGARREAERRSKVEEAGRVPIMAQGWLSGKRWEV